MVKRDGRRKWIMVAGVLSICWVFERRGKVRYEGLWLALLLLSWD